MTAEESRPWLGAADANGDADEDSLAAEGTGAEIAATAKRHDASSLHHATHNDASARPSAAACVRCGQHFAVVVVGWERGGHVFPACSSCADEAVRQGGSVWAFRPFRCEDCDIDARLVVWDAEGIVLAHDRGVQALLSLPTPALRSMQYVLLDDFYPVMIDELARRGEEL